MNKLGWCERVMSRGPQLFKLLIGLLLCLVPQSSQAQSAGTLPHAPPLSIEGELIEWSEYASWLVRLRGRDHVESFARRFALERESRAVGIELDLAALKAEVQSEITQRIERAFGGDRSQWERELAIQQLTPESHAAIRLDELVVERTTQALVQRRRVLSEAQLVRAWEREYGPQGTTLQLSRLFLGVELPAQPPGATRDEVLELGRKARAQALVRAKQLTAELERGAEFEALVEEHSQDATSRARGGKLEGDFIFKDWPGVRPADLLNLDVGQTSEPLYSRGGYNIFRVDVREQHPLEEVRAEVEELARGEAASASEAAALKAELFNALHIEVLDELDHAVSSTDPRLARPVFIIDGEPITRQRFAEWLVPTRGRTLVSVFVAHRTVDSLAREAGLSVSRVEIDTRASEDTQQLIQLFHKGDRDEWLAELGAKGQTEADFLRRVRLLLAHTLLAEKLLLARREVTPELIERTWRERYGEGGRSLDVRFIMKTIPTPAQGVLTSQADIERYIEEQTAAAMAFLAKLRARAQQGEDFSALARTYSEDPRTRDRGGRGVGRFALHTWPQEVQETLKQLAPGEIAPPYAMTNQFFLFELAGVVEVPLEEVREALALELRDMRPSRVEVAGFVNEQTRGLEVKVLPGMSERP